MIPIDKPGLVCYTCIRCRPRDVRPGRRVQVVYMCTRKHVIDMAVHTHFGDSNESHIRPNEIQTAV